MMSLNYRKIRQVQEACKPSIRFVPFKQFVIVSPDWIAAIKTSWYNKTWTGRM